MMARLIQVLVLTGARRTEAAHATTAEVAGDIWVLPATRMKAGRQHTVPLASMAAKVFADAITDSAPSPLVFPGKSGEPMEPTSVGHGLTRLLKVLKIENVRPHDLRRTMASTMGKLGIAEGTISRVLAHTQSSITATHYNLHSYDTEKRAAFERWEAELVRIASAAHSPGQAVAPAKLS